MEKTLVTNPPRPYLKRRIVVVHPEDEDVVELRIVGGRGATVCSFFMEFDEAVELARMLVEC